MLTFRYSIHNNEEIELAGDYVLTLGKSTWLGIASPVEQKELLEITIYFILKASSRSPDKSDHLEAGMHLISIPSPDHQNF